MPNPPRGIALLLPLVIAVGACAPAAAPANAQGNVQGSGPVVVAEESPPPAQAVAAAAPKDERKGGGEAPPPVASKPYDLVVSFRSQGQGIDRDARTRLDAIFDATPNLGRAHGRWGREGEVDECADVDRLAPADRAALVAKVRAAMQPAKNVDVLEHHECKHDFDVAEKRFELVVVFFSPGNGTDARAEQALDQVVKAWPAVKRASFPWGKEGEHNECFDFGADQAARDDFLHHVKTDIASSSRVRIYSDARCSVH